MPRGHASTAQELRCGGVPGVRIGQDPAPVLATGAFPIVRGDTPVGGVQWGRGGEGRQRLFLGLRSCTKKLYQETDFKNKIQWNLFLYCFFETFCAKTWYRDMVRIIFTGNFPLLVKENIYIVLFSNNSYISRCFFYIRSINCSLFPDDLHGVDEF